MPPYEGPDGLGSKNAPGLSRLEGATFTGEFPIAGIGWASVRSPASEMPILSALSVAEILPALTLRA